jgi:hypothetical protein
MPDILGDVLRRLEALEAAVLGQASVFFDRKLTKPQVALRRANSTRQLERDVKDGKHPPPDEIINGRWYWWLSTLERHDRERVQSVTRRPPNAGQGSPRKQAADQPDPTKKRGPVVTSLVKKNPAMSVAKTGSLLCVPLAKKRARR